MLPSKFFMLLDDIATVMDDVAVMTKIAAKKTAGVLGDDLALNAQQVTGINANRELPVVWAVFKGSLVNKLILVPVALLISYFLPMLIMPLLMIGGAFLCFEGCEKLVHKFLHSKLELDEHHKELVGALTNEQVDMVAFEKDKIKGAVRTDFILSAEIIAITLGVVAGATLQKQVAVLSGIAILMTIGVYGLVGLIVKLDDIGLWMHQKKNTLMSKLGLGMVKTMPYLMKALSIAGTAAMFMVGGGIISHGIPVVHHFIEDIVHGLPMTAILQTGIEALLGIMVGALIVAILTLGNKILKK